MSAQSKLKQLTKVAFEMAGESCPLGFDANLISETTAKLPDGLTEEILVLFTHDWPSNFFLGSIEIIGPERINKEHSELYPGLSITQHGMVCIGSNGAGDMFSYCTHDNCVYLLPHENFSDDGLVSDTHTEIEMNAANIKSVALSTWESLECLFDWAIVELEKMKNDPDNGG